MNLPPPRFLVLLVYLCPELLSFHFMSGQQALVKSYGGGLPGEGEEKNRMDQLPAESEGEGGNTLWRMRCHGLSSGQEGT